MSWILIILGVLILIFGAGFVATSPQFKNFQNLARNTKLLGTALVLLGLLFGCFVQIDNGYVGVTKLFGKVQSGVLTPGLNFVNPLYNVEELDIRTQNYTMSAIHSEGQVEGDDAIRVLTSDGLEVTMDLTVLYRLNSSEAPRLLKETGADYVDKIIRPIARTKIRDNAVRFEAVSLYSTKREEFETRIFKGIENEFKKRGIVLENILIRNIALPQAVKSTIEQKIQAEQEAQKMQFVLQKEKQEAERKRVEAQGIADYQSKINSTLTPELLKYEQIKAYKEMATSQNSKVIIMGSGNSPVILDSK